MKHLPESFGIGLPKIPLNSLSQNFSPGLSFFLNMVFIIRHEDISAGYGSVF